MKRLNREEMAQWLTEATPGAPVYLVGIGGCRMSGLAHLLLDAGFAVHGSDLQENVEVRQLRERGAEIFIGHAPEQLINARPGLVVYSSAIRTDNPELAAAEHKCTAGKDFFAVTFFAHESYLRRDWSRDTVKSLPAAPGAGGSG